jgi:hypothetical protein
VILLSTRCRPTTLERGTAVFGICYDPDVTDRLPSPEELAAWEAEFEAAAKRPLRSRFRYAFIHTYKPVLDDAPFRSFSSTAEYRAWCEANLPSWLGYGRAV